MSTLKVNTLTDTAATKSVPIADVVNGTARAWVNFNGTGTVAIRAQYNVASITDNATGNYTINFTNALTDANYSVSGCTDNTGANAFVMKSTAVSNTTTAASILTVSSAGTVDSSFVCLQVFR